MSREERFNTVNWSALAAKIGVPEDELKDEILRVLNEGYYIIGYEYRGGRRMSVIVRLNEERIGIHRSAVTNVEEAKAKAEVSI